MLISHFSSFIKDSRNQLGITQSELSRLSGVSLPTIQNIESGRGNPSFSTLEELIRPLGRCLHFELQAADWDALAVCGAPLMISKPMKMKPQKELLVKTLRVACLELTKGEPLNTDRERKAEAITALLWAIQSHYPTFYASNFSSVLFDSFIPRKTSGRLIKLKRQALAVVSTYL